MLGPRHVARLKRSRTAQAGLAVVLVLVAFAAFGPLVARHDPNVSDFELGVRMVDGRAAGPVGPGGTFLLGADRVYRDVFARLAYGARISLFIGVTATLISSAIGLVVGVVSGWYEGMGGLVVPWACVVAFALALPAVMTGYPGLAASAALLGLFGVALARMRRRRGAGRIAVLFRGPDLNADVALMRFVDVGLSFPFLLLVMAVGAALERTTALSILAVLGLTGWLGIARVVRAKTMQVRALEFVTASRALGESTPAILVRHVVPNVLGPLLVLSTASVAQMIVAESVLGYLGVGLAPPTPSWGHMLFEGQDYYLAAPWMVLAPGIAILLAVLGFNLLGEGLRDALDPQDG